jgi:hypothetical protein
MAGSGAAIPTPEWDKNSIFQNFLAILRKPL